MHYNMCGTFSCMCLDLHVHVYECTYKIDDLTIPQLEEKVSVTARSEDKGGNSRVSSSCLTHHTMHSVYMLVCMYIPIHLNDPLPTHNTDPVIT